MSESVKVRRVSFDDAADCAAMLKLMPTGVFGAEMQVSLVNDGPVTIAADSRNPE